MVASAFLQSPIQRAFANSASKFALFDIYLFHRESVIPMEGYSSSKKFYSDGIMVDQSVYTGNAAGEILLTCVERDTKEASGNYIYQAKLNHRLISAPNAEYPKIQVIGFAETQLAEHYLIRDQLKTFTNVKQLVFLLKHGECNVVTNVNPIKMYGSFKLTRRYDSVTKQPIELESEKKEGFDDVNACFLTTACVQAKGLADDCDELQTLRKFRDHYMMRTSYGQSLVEEYYDVAPTILSKINRSPDAKQMYEFMYQSLVTQSIHLIEQGRYDLAMEYYKAFTDELSHRLA